MDGDKPVTRPEDDRLGFAPVAQHLADAIVGLPAAAGFVFGVEGRWGSGKSTLISLTKTALQSRGADAPETIDFSPWLVGNREDLLRSMFAELANAAVKIDPIEQQLACDPPSKLLQREQFKKRHQRQTDEIRRHRRRPGEGRQAGRCFGHPHGRAGCCSIGSWRRCRKCDTWLNSDFRRESLLGQRSSTALAPHRRIHRRSR